MDHTSERRKKRLIWLLCAVAACVLVFLVVRNVGIVANAMSWLLNLVMPFALGSAIALVVNVPMRFVEGIFFPKAESRILNKIRRPLAFGASLVLIFGIIVGIVWLIIPEIVHAVMVVVRRITAIVTELSVMDQTELASHPLGNLILSVDWDKYLDMFQGWVEKQGGTIVNTAFGTITTVVGGFFDVFVAVFFSMYLLFGKDRLKKQAKRLARAWLPEKSGEWTIHAASVANVNLRNFISGQFIEAVILGVLCMVGMFALQLPYAPMVSTLVGVTALIPVVGAFVGAIVGAFIILLLGSPIKAIIFVVFLVILQQIEGNLIYPKVMGNRVNMPGIWILVAVTLGGSLAGPVGMLLSVPLASTIYMLTKEATVNREKERAAQAQQTSLEV